MPNGPVHLYVPGPTNVPDAVRRAMNVPQQDHRAPDFPDLALPLFADLKKVYDMDYGSHDNYRFREPVAIPEPAE